MAGGGTQGGGDGQQAVLCTRCWAEGAGPMRDRSRAWVLLAEPCILALGCLLFLTSPYGRLCGPGKRDFRKGNESQEQFCILEGCGERSAGGEAGRPRGRLCSCSSKNWRWFGAGGEYNKEVSQQDLEVNWTGVLGHGGVSVTAGSSQAQKEAYDLEEMSPDSAKYTIKTVQGLLPAL